MSFLPCEGHAGPSVHAELDHLIPIVEEEIAEAGRLLALLSRTDRQIKGDD